MTKVTNTLSNIGTFCAWVLLCWAVLGHAQTVTSFSVTTPEGVIVAGTVTVPASTTIVTPPPAPVTTSGVSSLLFAGDSFMYGIGATNYATTSFAALVSTATPGVPTVNVGHGGATSDAIVNSVFANYVQTPTAGLILNSGANDGQADSCAGQPATPCIQNYVNTMNAGEAWGAIPPSYRIMASAAQVVGPWALPNIYQITYVPLSPTVAGTMLETQGVNSLIFTTPASWNSSVLGINYVPVNGQTGTFQVSVDGVLQTDNCSGTTTFSSGPCSGVNIDQVQRTVFRQEMPVTTPGSHRVVVQSMSMANVGILGVDGVPPVIALLANGTNQAPTQNFVFVSGTTANFINGPLYDAASHALADHLKAEGLNVFFVDVEHGTPGINTTTDLSLVAMPTCPASTSGGHPNDCGMLHWFQTLQNTEATVGYTFTK